jgi:putative intracellular protease/amidase
MATSGDKPKPMKYGIALFPGFQALDVFGPVDILNILARSNPMEIAVLAPTLDPVSTAIVDGGFGQSVAPTHTYADAPKDLEVLLVPGGFGTRNEEQMVTVIEYLKMVYPSLQYLLTVCTGSALIAKAGLIDGKRATSNKRAWKWVSCILDRTEIPWELTQTRGNCTRPEC